jgi:hypothetical protein
MTKQNFENPLPFVNGGTSDRVCKHADTAWTEILNYYLSADSIKHPVFCIFLKYRQAPTFKISSRLCRSWYYRTFSTQHCMELIHIIHLTLRVPCELDCATHAKGRCQKHPLTPVWVLTPHVCARLTQSLGPLQKSYTTFQNPKPDHIMFAFVLLYSVIWIKRKVLTLQLCISDGTSEW